ncbi:signal peptidase II [Marinobacterium aestuariivivens]|uniref:Lipoprotein signal peptidase n=1 Tax=Marinobacterium aestuariivivens TaxID=1698799 RepID=A0ABW2A0L7_9GAMM
MTELHRSDARIHEPDRPGSSLVWLWLSALVILLDQGSKWLAEQWLEYGDANRILPVFDLTLLYNRGAAFSFLAEAGGWQRWFFALVALVVSVALVIWMKRTARVQWWLGMGLSLLLGGALGNLYDRVVHGHVIDFISLHWGPHYFPAFNIADSAITLGPRC